MSEASSTGTTGGGAGMFDADLLVIGGGINGAGIARDAAGRGLKVVLCEKGDLSGATSSASSKLIHGGLRYLEQYEFRLVREALMEREVLLKAAPHLIRPLRFVMPHTKGLRPIWMIRIGLFLYDRLGGRTTLPGSETVLLDGTSEGEGLKPEYRRGFTYFDCWADDARLVVANARGAADRGAHVFTRTRFEGAAPESGGWRARLNDTVRGRTIEVRAGALVNATGPWVNRVIENVSEGKKKKHVRLVKGSHIAVPRVYRGEHALILQNDDERVVFVIPYADKYSVIGTTDVAVEGDPEEVGISNEEIDYLCRAVNRYLASPVSPDQITWTYAGVRPLYDDGETDPSKITRDYELELQAPAPDSVLLTVYGGKLTTYRRLAEHALEMLADRFPRMKPAWTHDAPLPGGTLPRGSFQDYVSELERTFPFVPTPELERLIRRHGADCDGILRGATRLDDLGEHFGDGLYAREVDFLCDREWALTDEDILWRRTKCGLAIGQEGVARLKRYLADREAADGSKVM